MVKGYWGGSERVMDALRIDVRASDSDNRGPKQRMAVCIGVFTSDGVVVRSSCG